MNGSIVFGLFALYVAGISLYLVLSGKQDALLAQLRRIWGRSVGHAFYFIGNVALPLLVCVVCLGWGVREYDPVTAFRDFDSALHLHLDSYRDLSLLLNKEQVADSLGIVYGA